MNKEMWERTGDEKCHSPKFPIWCRFCDTDMVMRFSSIYVAPNTIKGLYEPGNQVAYKCPKCGYHVRFNVVDDEDYLRKILELRDGKAHFQPTEEWEEEAIIKKQLEGLGYWGGRDVEEG